MSRRRLPRAVLWLVYAFLYLPIAVVVAMSFNASQNLFVWRGFTLSWYQVALTDPAVLAGLGNTVVVAASATALAVLLGTTLAVGLHRYTKGALVRAFATAPALMPDLLLAIGLLSLFSALKVSLGLHTVVLAHTVFGTAFVVAIVLARLAQLDPSLEDASADLGAGPARTFWKVTVPELAPGIVAAAVLVFTLSLDEFVIAFFTAAPNTPTLPIVIYSMVRFGVTPEINALGTVLLAVSVTGLLLAQRLTKFTEAL